jgi:hypothetical protein
MPRTDPLVQVDYVRVVDLNIGASKSDVCVIGVVTISERAGGTRAAIVGLSRVAADAAALARVLRFWLPSGLSRPTRPPSWNWKTETVAVMPADRRCQGAHRRSPFAPECAGRAAPS